MSPLLSVLIAVMLNTVSLTAADAFSAWLSTPPAQRAEQRDEQMRAARRSGDRWLAAYLEVLGIADAAKRAPAAEQVAVQSPAERKPWLILVQAQALFEAKQSARAQALLEPVWSEAQGRLRYECDRVLSEILRDLGRTGEAADLAREAQDLATRVLYADKGIDTAGLNQSATVEDPAAALYRQADDAREKADWPTALNALRTIATKHQASPWAAPARVLHGWVLLGQGKATDADTAWAAFIAENPAGPWRGAAQVARIDTALEVACDAAVAAARTSELAGQVAARADASNDAGTPGDGWAPIARELELRRILLDIVANRLAEAQRRAQALLGTGRDQAAQPPDAQGVYQPATGVGKLLERLASGHPLTPPEALVTGREAVNLRLILADWWILIDEPIRARRIFNQVLSARSPATPDQRCYARMTYADLDFAAWKAEDFRAGYEQALKDRPQNPWAARQHLVLAVDDYGRLHQEALALARLTRIQRDYPASPQSRSAGWYRGVIAFWGGHWQDAAAAFNDLDQRYPDHPWRGVIATNYRPRVIQAIAAKLPADAPPPPPPNQPVAPPQPAPAADIPPQEAAP